MHVKKNVECLILDEVIEILDEATNVPDVDKNSMESLFSAGQGHMPSADSFIAALTPILNTDKSVGRKLSSLYRRHSAAPMTVVYQLAVPALTPASPSSTGLAVPVAPTSAVSVLPPTSIESSDPAKRSRARRSSVQVSLTRTAVDAGFTYSDLDPAEGIDQQDLAHVSLIKAVKKAGFVMVNDPRRPELQFLDPACIASGAPCLKLLEAVAVDVGMAHFPDPSSWLPTQPPLCVWNRFFVQSPR